MALYALQSRSVGSKVESEMEVDDADFLEVEKLQEAGLNAADLKKLKESGFHTVTSVLYSMKKDLVAVKGLSEQKVEKVQEAARKLCDAGFVSGTELVRSREKQFPLSTGCGKFDQMLAGGVESCSIGQPASTSRRSCGSFSTARWIPSSPWTGTGLTAYSQPQRMTGWFSAYGGPTTRARSRS